jgi:hypothetical protein
VPLTNSVLTRHLTRMQLDGTITFTWLGNPYSAIKSTPNFSQTLMIGGFDEQVQFDLFVILSDLPYMPVEGAVFVISGKSYKVLRVRPSPDNSQLVAFSMGWARLDSTIV